MTTGERKMEDNIKVARFHEGLSWLYRLLVVLWSVILLVPSKDHIIKEESTPLEMYFIIYGIFGGLFLLHYYTARGAKRKKKWARNVSWTVGSLMLFAFPIGTILGGYLIYSASGWRE